MSQITKTTNSSLMLFDRQHCNKVINDRNSRLSSLIQLADSEELDESTKEQLNKLQKRVKTLPSQRKFFDNRIDGRKISNISKKKLIQKICKRIIDLYDRDQPIEITLEKVLKPYTKN